MIPHHPLSSIAVMSLIGAGNLWDELIALGVYLDLRSQHPDAHLHFFGYDLDRVLLRSLMKDDKNLSFHHFFPHHLKTHPLKNISYLFDTLKTIQKSDLLLIWGGGIFYDYESNQSISKQVYEWKLRVYLAQLTRTPIEYRGISIDVQEHHLNKYRSLFVCAKSVQVRDTHSVNLLKKIDIHSHQESDYVIKKWDEIQKVCTQIGASSKKPTPLSIGISLRSGLTHDDRDTMRELIASLRHSFPDVSLIGLAFSYIPGSQVDDSELLWSLDLDELITDQVRIMETIPTLSYSISMRLHAMIVSYLSWVPTICLSYATKTQEIAKELSSKGYHTPLVVTSLSQYPRVISTLKEWIHI